MHRNSKNASAQKCTDRAALARLTEHRPQRPDTGRDQQASPAINDAESPLSWLRGRKDKSGRPLISSEQYLAGERLRHDYERSIMGRRVTSNWDLSATAGRSGHNSSLEISDGALAARQRFHKAIDAIGPELSSILTHVCCMSAGIEQAERVLELPPRSGKAVLGLALTALARHYGLLRETAPPRAGSPIGRWSLPDYRPTVPSTEDA